LSAVGFDNDLFFSRFLVFPFSKTFRYYQLISLRVPNYINLVTPCSFATEYYSILSGLWFRKWHIKAYFDFEPPGELLSLLDTIYYRIDSLFRSIAEIDLSPEDNKEVFLQWLDETRATLQKYT